MTQSVLRAGLISLVFVGAPAAQAAVGRTAGIPTVLPTGEASYSIPFNLPPGARDLTPGLGLTYSSETGMSVAGVGWSIAGISSIQRCASTVAQDGTARDVRNDWYDRFCLDGQKLRLVTGSYGGTGSTYRTEIESFARVTLNETSSYGPTRFTVERANGFVYEYGNTTDSRIESVGASKYREWALNKIRDRQGNQISFTYAFNSATGSYHIDLATYTGNPGQGVAPPYSVDFVYENRPAAEIQLSYIAGSPVQELQRLDRVDVLYNSTVLVRRYDLNYAPALSATGRSRLVSVQECMGDSVDCVPPKQFTYYDGAPYGGEMTAGATVTQYSVWPMDVNGDGREDVAYSSSATSGSGYWRVMFANAQDGYSAPVNVAITNTNFADAIPIDYNQDGRGDLLVPYSGSTWWVMLGTASGFAAPTNTSATVTTTGRGTNAAALDVDGDGLQDLVWADLIGYAGGDAIRYRLRIAGGGFSTTINTLAGPLPVDLKLKSGMFGAWRRSKAGRAPDFNGDGRTDLAYQTILRIPGIPDRPGEPGEPDQYSYTTTAYCPGGTSFSISSDELSSTYGFGDFNADGKTDVFYVSGSTWRARLSTGTGFTSEINAGGTSGYSSIWAILDWDGDGKDDVLAKHSASSSWHVLRSTGEAFQGPVGTGFSLPTDGGLTTVATDINGDGGVDIAYTDTYGSELIDT